jgi:hypothetical protein
MLKKEERSKTWLLTFFMAKVGGCKRERIKNERSNGELIIESLIA